MFLSSTTRSGPFICGANPGLFGVFPAASTRTRCLSTPRVMPSRFMPSFFKHRELLLAVEHCTHTHARAFMKREPSSPSSSSSQRDVNHYDAISQTSSSYVCCLVAPSRSGSPIKGPPPPPRSVFFSRLLIFRQQVCAKTSRKMAEVWFWLVIMVAAVLGVLAVVVHVHSGGAREFAVEMRGPKEDVEAGGGGGGEEETPTEAAAA